MSNIDLEVKSIGLSKYFDPEESAEILEVDPGSSTISYSVVTLEEIPIITSLIDEFNEYGDYKYYLICTENGVPISKTNLDENLTSISYIHQSLGDTDRYNEFNPHIGKYGDLLTRVSLSYIDDSLGEYLDRECFLMNKTKQLVMRDIGSCTALVPIDLQRVLDLWWRWGDPFYWLRSDSTFHWYCTTFYHISSLIEEDSELYAYNASTPLDPGTYTITKNVTGSSADSITITTEDYRYTTGAVAKCKRLYKRDTYEYDWWLEGVNTVYIENYYASDEDRYYVYLYLDHPVGTYQSWENSWIAGLYYDEFLEWFPSSVVYKEIVYTEPEGEDEEGTFTIYSIGNVTVTSEGITFSDRELDPDNDAIFYFYTEDDSDQ